VLLALARVIAARVGRSPTGADTASLSLAHAVAAERERLTRELTHDFAGKLQTILDQLRNAAPGDFDASLHVVSAQASQMLADLRGRRPGWRQARRVDEAFAAVGREIGELARSGGFSLECALEGRPEHLIANTVLETACWITRAAVLNVADDAQAVRGRVAWSVVDDELVVSVIDDGGRVDPDREARGRLRGMRRRAESLGGSVQIDSMAGWGTRLRAYLRLQPENVPQVDESASALVQTLADRELDVLRLIAVGHRNRDIATELGLSPHTVKYHLGNIFHKLGARTRAEAAAVAFAAGIHPRPASGLSASDD
jgi:DNA-binding CsgD family transcriptional regulator/signal transduction histidine kinase